MSGIDQRHLLNKCLVIDLRRSPKVNQGHRRDLGDLTAEDGFAVFKAWLSVNLETFWSPPLLSALRRLTLVGLLRPCMFLVTAAPGHLEVIRSAWTQRTLRAPPGFTVAMLGEAHGYSVTPVAPGHFTSLPEAICHVIYSLNGENPDMKVTLDDVCCHLRRHFPHLELPDRQLVFSTLGRLVRERKVYHTALGYRIVTPATYQQQLALELEEQASRSGSLVTRTVQTDLADIILGGSDADAVIHARPVLGDALTSSLGLSLFSRRHSMKLTELQREEHFRRAASMRYPSSVARPAASQPRFSDETATSAECSILERPSLFSKLLRLAAPHRPQPVHLATFSAQFPPPEWTGGDVTHLHSVGTQTVQQKQRRGEDSPKFLRSRRQRSRRFINGSNGHLPDADVTTAFNSDTKMAPRSSTLPRRNKLSAYLAEQHLSIDCSDATKKPSRRKREKSRTLDPSSVSSSSPHLGGDDTTTGDSFKHEDFTQSTGALNTDKISSDSSAVSASRRTDPLESRSQSLAQRHVRERLEARHRHSSSRTSSGSSLERTDASATPSLERGVKHELSVSPRDGRPVSVGVLSSSNASPVLERQHARSESEGSRSAIGNDEESAVLEAPTGDRKSHFRSTSCSPKHSGHSYRSSSRQNSRSSGMLAQSEAFDVCDKTDDAEVMKKQVTAPERKSRASPKKSRESPVSLRIAEIPAHDMQEHVQTDLPSKSRHHRSSKRSAYEGEPVAADVSVTNDSHEDPKLVSPYRKSSSKKLGGHLKTEHGSVESVSEHVARRRKRIESILKRDKSAPGEIRNHREESHSRGRRSPRVVSAVLGDGEGDVLDNTKVAMKDEKAEKRAKKSSPRHVKSVDKSKRRPSSSTAASEEPIYVNIDALVKKEPVPRVNSDTFAKTPAAESVRTEVSESRAVLSPPVSERGKTDKKHSRHLKARGTELGHCLKGNNEICMGEVIKKQMNNEKVIDALSPTRAEPLSVKNIFTDVRSSPKVPPKTPIESIPHDGRIGRSLTFKDLVKNSPEPTQDASRTTEPALVQSKMAGVALPQSKMAADDLAPSKTADPVPARKPDETIKTPESEQKPSDSTDVVSLRTYPSLSSLNLNFKSLAAQRLINGNSANSIDTLVEVNMAAERRRESGEATLLGIL